MDLQKLNPWNWFKHEEPSTAGNQVPVKRSVHSNPLPMASAAGTQPLLQLHQEIDQLFEDVFRGFGFPSRGGTTRALSGTSGWGGDGAFRPNLNVSSDNESYQISMDVPGLTETDLSIEVRGDVMTIQGQKREETENKDRHFYRVERRYGAFQRTLALPEDANVDQIKATMKDGVLNLRIPRNETLEADVKKITIG